MVCAAFMICPICFMDGFAPKAGRLVRATAEIAKRAELVPCMVRLGRVVSCEGGRVVLDNEMVLGFWPGVDPGEAYAHIAGAGDARKHADAAEQKLNITAISAVIGYDLDDLVPGRRVVDVLAGQLLCDHVR